MHLHPHVRYGSTEEGRVATELDSSLVTKASTQQTIRPRTSGRGAQLVAHATLKCSLANFELSLASRLAEINGDVVKNVFVVDNWSPAEDVEWATLRKLQMHALIRRCLCWHRLIRRHSQLELPQRHGARKRTERHPSATEASSDRALTESVSGSEKDLHSIGLLHTTHDGRWASFMPG